MESSDRPKLTVITPAYNEELYVRDMIRSVKMQSLDSWELVMVDDGSTDRTADIIRAECQSDPRIRLVSEGSRLRKVPAFNLAYRESRGEIICHIGADDLASHDSLERRFVALSPYRDQKAVAFSKINMFRDGEDHRKGGTIVPRGNRGNRTGPGIAFNRSLGDLLFPIPEILPSEDIWLGKGAIHLAEHVVEILEPLVNYRINAGNSNPRNRSFKQMDVSMASRTEALPELMRSERFNLPDSAVQELADSYELELLRRQHKTLAILASRNFGVIERLGVASMSNAPLWWLRKRFLTSLSGWR